MKKSFFFFYILFIFFSSLSAQNSSYMDTDILTASHIYDERQLLSAEEKSGLNRKIKETEERHDYKLGLYLALVTSYSDYGFYSIEDFSEYFYKENKLGYGQDKNGILFIISYKEREYDICAYGDFSHKTYTDFGKNKLAAYCMPSLKKLDFYQAFDSFINKAEVLLVYSEKGHPFDRGSFYFDPESLIIALITALALSFIAGMIVTLLLKGKMNNVKAAKDADSYAEADKIKILYRSDSFTHNTVIRSPINQNSAGPGRPSGGTSINAGGFSHSSGKF